MIIENGRQREEGRARERKGERESKAEREEERLSEGETNWARNEHQKQRTGLLHYTYHIEAVHEPKTEKNK